MRTYLVAVALLTLPLHFPLTPLRQPDQADVSATVPHVERVRTGKPALLDTAPPEGSSAGSTTQSEWHRPQKELTEPTLVLTVRPATLADFIGELAGKSVRMQKARVVGLFEPRAFLVESETSLRPALGHRDRILVLVERGALQNAPETIVGSTVTVLGVARTLLGLQTTREVPWPAKLDHRLVERLEVRAGVLATSVQTAEGVELTGPGGSTESSGRWRELSGPSVPRR